MKSQAVRDLLWNGQAEISRLLYPLEVLVGEGTAGESEGREHLPALASTCDGYNVGPASAVRVPLMTSAPFSSWPRRASDEATNATAKIVMMTPRLTNAGIL